MLTVLCNGCLLFGLGMLEKTEVDEMKKYILNDGGTWTIERIEHGDSTWMPGGTLKFHKKRDYSEHSAWKRAELKLASGEVNEMGWGFDGEHCECTPVLQFYKSDSSLRPEGWGDMTFELDVWEQDRLVLGNGYGTLGSNSTFDYLIHLKRAR